MGGARGSDSLEADSNMGYHPREYPTERKERQEMMQQQFRFVDLFAGLGGFHSALSALGGHCVLASEIDTELRELYEKNFGLMPEGDIRQIATAKIPAHEVLCAGFPCQPFSKAGEQLGTDCPLWGDLFDYVVAILQKHKPDYFILENVPNLLRHNNGETWNRMRQDLEDCGYKGAIDWRKLSPHKFGIPQIRERAYIVGSARGLKHFNWPEGSEVQTTSIVDFLEKSPHDAKPISGNVANVLSIWQNFLDKFPASEELPSFPIWAMEFGADYPYEHVTPARLSSRELLKFKGAFGSDLKSVKPQERLSHLPGYAVTSEPLFPSWKRDFIRQNRALYERHEAWIDKWISKLRGLPPSHQKFEWNCKGEERNIWKHVIQFRASGVRVKRPTSSPSLIACTSTQVPIIGWEKRYLTPRECARIQSLGDLKHLPKGTTGSYRALGNAVNVEVVRAIARALLGLTVKEDK